jgi:hypothetical protein
MTVPNELRAFVSCTVVPSRGRHRFQNLLNFPLFGSSILRLDRVGGCNRNASFSEETNSHTIACYAYKPKHHRARLISSFLALAF